MKKSIFLIVVMASFFSLAFASDVIKPHAFVFNPLTGSCFYAELENPSKLSSPKRTTCKGDELKLHVESVLEDNGKCAYLIGFSPDFTVKVRDDKFTWVHDICYEVKKPQA